MSKKTINKGGMVYSTNPDYMSQFNVEQETETLANTNQLLKVKLDTKQRAGKVVTLIDGFIGKPQDLDALGKMLKTKCGTGGSVKDGLILLQGDYKEKVILLLKQNNYTVKA